MTANVPVGKFVDEKAAQEMDDDRLLELLEEYETDVLKETIKALRAKISEYNDELVNLLEEKDTLEQHREEKIVDIKDLATIL